MSSIVRFDTQLEDDPSAAIGMVNCHCRPVSFDGSTAVAGMPPVGAPVPVVEPPVPVVEPPVPVVEPPEPVLPPVPPPPLLLQPWVAANIPRDASPQRAIFNCRDLDPSMTFSFKSFLKRRHP